MLSMLGLPATPLLCVYARNFTPKEGHSFISPSLQLAHHLTTKFPSIEKVDSPQVAARQEARFLACRAQAKAPNSLHHTRTNRYKNG